MANTIDNMIKVQTKSGSIINLITRGLTFVYYTEVKTRRTNGKLEHLISISISKAKVYNKVDALADAVAMALTSAKRREEIKRMDKFERRRVTRDINFAMLIPCDFNKLYNVNQ